ncbi:MAG: hypothetical protein V4736_16335 [Bdellovibrionota bacterium]
MKLLTLALLLGVLATSCDRRGSVNDTTERVKVEQQADTDVQNENLAAKAEKMEKDLARRHNYYAATEGEYAGDLTVGNSTYKIKFTFARSIPPYLGERVRELSEIENDLNNLFFYIQIVQWHPADPATAVGCRVSNIRPNMEEGSFTIATPDCPNLYTVYLSANGDLNSAGAKANAKALAKSINENKIDVVGRLVGSVQPSTNASRYVFKVSKVK